MKDLTSQEFLQMSERELSKAWQIVISHDQDGENEIVPLSKMFPHGAPDAMFLIYMKISRALGYYTQPSLRHKVYEELQDILNYAAFTLTLLQIESEGETLCRPS